MMTALILLSILMAGVAATSEKDDPIVQTPLGSVRGYRMTSRGGRQFMAFSGVPYAQPPIGKLRFQPPVPLEPWKSVKDALEDGPLCIQSNYSSWPTPIGKEDCLYLSLYTHNISSKAPVLVHIHRGAYEGGIGDRTSGPQYLMDEDVVIVNVNFRLHVFGFLSFEDLDMPGNQGLKDQVQALRWVQQNIASFGGDPNRVTLIGESSGAQSVYHHIVSPLSKGLFHRAVAESGTSYNPWALSSPGTARNASMQLLPLLGCNHKSTKEAVACLIKKDAHKLFIDVDFKNVLMQLEIQFRPVLEPPSPSAFLVGPVSEWKHNPVPLLMGSTSAEGLAKTIMIPYFKSFASLTNDFETSAPRSLQILNTASDPLEVVRALRQYYLPNKSITKNDLVNLTMLYGDSLVTIGILDGANKHSGDVYFYYFDYLGEKSFGGRIETRDNKTIFGAFHADEVIYLWYNEKYGDLKGDDLVMSRKLVKIWTDFAKYGKPENSELHWPKWTAQKKYYMEISKNGFNLKEGLADERYKFWKTLNYYDRFG